jgi:putative SOS response-associated peptidase YedK
MTQKEVGAVAEDLGARYEESLAASWRPRYNVAPTQPAVIARLEDGQPWLRMGTWGFAPPGGGKLSINARSETADRRGMFARAFASRRCVVPADGFFEWTGARSDRRPIWFHAASGRLVYFAGIWQPGPDGEPAFAILTTAPSPEVAEVHDRMPVVLDVARARAWLERPDRALLGPAPAGWLVGTEVSRRVNDVENDDPECLAAPTPTGQMPLL